MQVSSVQQEAMLEFVLLAAEEEGARPFPEYVMSALLRVVRCDTVAYRAWSSPRRIVDRSYAPAELADRWPVWLHYPRFRHDDPHPSEPPMRRGDPPPVSAVGLMARSLVLRDAISDRRLRQTGLYAELMRPFAVRNVLKLFLPREGALSSVFVFDTSSSGFGETDRALLERLVPALVQFQRSAQLRRLALHPDSRLMLLTPRELTVLARATAGETNEEIARALVIGPSTVRKHLEHVYEKLEVRNRTAAAAVYAGTPRRQP